MVEVKNFESDVEEMSSFEMEVVLVKTRRYILDDQVITEILTYKRLLYHVRCDCS